MTEYNKQKGYYVSNRTENMELFDKKLKRCGTCSAIKGISKFHLNGRSKNTTGGFESSCKECRKNNKRTDRSEKLSTDVMYDRRKALWTKFRMTLEDYEVLLKEQNNQCAICKKGLNEVSPNRSFFDVDHSHISGKIRGLLCRKCNLILGFAQDNKKILGEAISYLTRFDPLDEEDYIDEEEDDYEWYHH